MRQTRTSSNLTLKANDTSKCWGWSCLRGSARNYSPPASMNTRQREKELKEENSSSQSHLREIAAAVEAVLCVEDVLSWQEAQTRIPDWLQSQTFFSELDYWKFTAIMDDRTCFACNVLDKIMFTGTELRLFFPYMVLFDFDTILAYVHPHCRCILTRMMGLLDYNQIDNYP